MLAPKRKRLQRVSSTGSFTLHTSDDDDDIITPKKVRQQLPPTPSTLPRPRPRGPALPTSPTRPATKPAPNPNALPAPLAHLLQLHTSLESLLALKLASVSLSPSAHPDQPNTLRITNVCTHAQLERAAGRRCATTEVARLCWIYEGGMVAQPALPDRPETPVKQLEDENPFLVSTPTKPRPEEWVRGGLGVTLSPMRVVDTETGKRKTVYAFGIESDVGEAGSRGGMGVVHRWLSGKEARVRAVEGRIRAWLKQNKVSPLPPFPTALLPPLIQPPTMLLTPATQRTYLMTPSKPRSLPFATPTPTKVLPEPKRTAMGPPDITPTKQTKAPSVDDEGRPVTPTNQTGRVTPSSGSSVKDRKSALLERIAARSSTPKGSGKLLFRTAGDSTEERIVTSEELKRRSALSRLADVAEGVYMLFSSAGGPDLATPPTRRRRAIPMEEVVGVIVKSSRVAVSEADARSSLLMLTTLCPFFLRVLVISGAEWLEAPSSSALAAPPSPGKVAVEEVASRAGGSGGSPKRVRKEDGGLREVRERIRRELEGI